jgi:O-methyltransferase domain
LLKNCRQGVSAGGKLLVVDAVIDPGNGFNFAKFLDLEMLIFPGGLERTETQFRKIFSAAGWKLERVIATASGVSIVEGVCA